MVIALAVKSLGPRERKVGIGVGAGLAVALRIVLTFFAAKLLLIEFVKLAGGVLILWIAVKLLVDDTSESHGTKEANTLWQAMVYILIADITMSTDNILAIAGTSKGHLGLLIFGLGLSIPFVVFTSNLLAAVMDRFPVIVVIGAAILGRVGGEMILTDPWVHGMFKPAKWVEYLAQAVFAVGVVAAGKYIAGRRKPVRVMKAAPVTARERAYQPDGD
ncbi:MAG: hypothetical protein IANPNBLG_03094 [Bryobacteraceae bacterium]|nr:hypothetical protein [Bryobacteraceae bacterium]